MVDTMGAGDALITAFMVEYIARKKAKGIVEEADVSECLYKAADFASQACGFEGAWGYPKKYE
jgi:sugar/nucleoside kinase (ribokinase family)